MSSHKYGLEYEVGCQCSKAVSINLQAKLTGALECVTQKGKAEPNVRYNQNILKCQ